MNPEGAPRSGRLLRRLPRLTVYSWAELILLALVALQCARLFWIAVAPIGPVGDWRAPGAAPAVSDTSILAAFDPFFRLDQASGPTQVTALNLRLYGVREDRATGRGSAIIALPDGQQLSFGVGEEIMPGVTLTAVGFDNVTISRGGATEQIFLDQSPPAQVVGAPGAPITTVPTPLPVVTVAPPPAANLPVNFQPRAVNGRVTGIVVTPAGDGQAFRAAGFAPGDAIVAINGQRVTSLEQVRGALGQGGGAVAVTVDRGGQSVSLTVRLVQ